MSMILRDPLHDVVSLREVMDQLFEDSFVRPSRRWVAERRGVANLPLDVYSTPEEIVVMAAVPGLKPEDVDITLEGDTLTIKGEFKPILENVNYELQERYHGAFSRTLTVNVPIDQNKVEATFDSGLLTLVLPKAAEVRPKTIKVQAK